MGICILLIIVEEIFRALFKGAARVIQIVWPITIVVVAIVAVVFVIKRNKNGSSKKPSAATHKHSQSSSTSTQGKTKPNHLSKSSNKPHEILGNKCCVCGRELRNGYAVLFITEKGIEARICETCHSTIDILAKSDKVDALERSIKYMNRFMGRIDREVEQKIKEYVDSAQEFMESVKSAYIQTGEERIGSESAPARRS